MRNRRTMLIIQSLIIAGLYVLLTFIFEDFSFHEAQVRVSEALTILPAFTPGAVPGLFAGCLISNILNKAPVIDILLGSFATLIAAVFTFLLTKKLPGAKPWLLPIPPIVINALVVPVILRQGYGIMTPYSKMMLTVGRGQIISYGLFGLLLYFFLNKYGRTSRKPSRNDRG